MKIEVTWDDEDKTIICYRFQPGWTLEEFYEVYDSVSDMVKLSPKRVIGIIVDDSNASRPPPNALGAFTRTVTTGKLPLAIVGSGYVSMTLMRVAEKTTTNQRPIFYTKTIEEARSTLRKFAEENPTQ